MEEEEDDLYGAGQPQNGEGIPAFDAAPNGGDTAMKQEDDQAEMDGDEEEEDDSESVRLVQSGTVKGRVG